MSHSFDLGEDLLERIMQLASVSAVTVLTGHWMLTLASQREALLACARRLEATGDKTFADQLRAEVYGLALDNPLGPLDSAVAAFHLLGIPTAVACPDVAAPATHDSDCVSLFDTPLDWPTPNGSVSSPRH